MLTIILKTIAWVLFGVGSGWNMEAGKTSREVGYKISGVFLFLAGLCSIVGGAFEVMSFCEGGCAAIGYFLFSMVFFMLSIIGGMIIAKKTRL